jgi:beta-1,4-mannosyl-glycoprotein beta-1,4-N-acetylglucosaminyltransferase
MAKIYDSFMFFNELDLLDIRLTMLYPYVDYFVISECDYTFSGVKKPFYFEENKGLFSKFLDKIIHVKNLDTNNIDILNNVYENKQKNVYDKIIEYFNVAKNSADTDYGKPQWCKEFLHREYVSLGLANCDDDDIIIFSDLDEIPKPEIIKHINGLDVKNNKYCLYSDNHNYFINNLASINWMGSIITNYGDLKINSLNNLRKIRANNVMLENSGWHLSFMGGQERIKHKLESYGHQEFNNDYIKSDIENKINKNVDLFNRISNFKKIEIDGYYPNNIVNLVKDKYPYLIK